MQIDDYVVHVVDDEEPVRKSLAFLLTMSGFTVRMHKSATSFLNAAPSLGRACLVTDLRMPDMSGVELLMRGERRGRNGPCDCHHRSWRRANGGCRNESWRRGFH